MRYENIERAIFVKRENRFVAKVLLFGKEEKVHVKNTGRLGELLLPGAEVILSGSAKAERKTAYDLIGVYHDGKLFNIDSQACNQVVREWLSMRVPLGVKPEKTYRDSRLDFYWEEENEETVEEEEKVQVEREEKAKGEKAKVEGEEVKVERKKPKVEREEERAEIRKQSRGRQQAGLQEPHFVRGTEGESVHSGHLTTKKVCLEVKGCTLEKDGVGYFPDAPTSRGAKHLHDLVLAREEGYEAHVGFVIQMEGVWEVRPNVERDPAFAAALAEAKDAGVGISFFLTSPRPEEMIVTRCLGSLSYLDQG